MGGNAPLGRSLGYRDGAYVGQMLRGARPVSDETLVALGSLYALRHLRPTIEELLPRPVTLSGQATATARATAALSVGKPPELEQALPVVLDAIARCSQQAELMDRLRMLAQYGRPEDRQRVAELLGALPGSELDQAA